MVLCVILCNLHGLVFLPAFLILLDSCVVSLRTAWKKARSEKGSNKISPNGTKNGVMTLNGKTINPCEDSVFVSNSENLRKKNFKHNISVIPENSTSCDRPDTSPDVITEAFTVTSFTYNQIT